MVAPTTPRVVAGLRRLVWGRGLSALGDGVWFTVWAIFFTRMLGLPAATVGIGMAVAAGGGLALAVPLGALADRRDPRRVLIALILLRAVAMAGFLLVRDPVAVLAVMVLFVAPANGANAVRTALVAGLVPDNAGRTRALAQQRVAQHIGYAVGAGLGAAVLSADRLAAYHLAVAGNVLSFVALAALTAAVPAPHLPAAAAPVRGGLRLVVGDRPYLAVVATTAVLSLCWAMLSTGLPLWIADATRLPLGLSGVVVMISSVGIAVLQVPATRLGRTPVLAARTARWSGVALAASCLVLVTTSGRAGPAVAGVVVLAAMLHLLGELGYVAASWTLSIDLMREHARGAYQGAAEAATATVQVLGPGFFALALDGLGAGGWVLAAVVFLAAAMPVPALTRWAVRTRGRPAASVA